MRLTARNLIKYLISSAENNSLNKKERKEERMIT